MTAVLEAEPQLEADETISTAELLLEHVDVSYPMLWRWVREGVLTAGGRRSGYRWTPAQVAAARAVAAAWRQGFDRPALWRVAHAVDRCHRYAEPCRCEWPDLIIVINPRTAADLEPLDRHTLVVQL